MQIMHCINNPNVSTNIIVNQLPIIDLNLDDICEQHPSFVLNQATPIGGVYYINEQTTNYFDIENLDIGGYNIKYE